MTEDGPLWVFGYGSLLFKQDFPFLESRPSRITGWARRFWQGSHDHRGVPDDPGRVVTLVEAPTERCEGIAFLVESEVLEHLDYREKNGYQRIEVLIEFGDEAVDGLVYRAPPDNAAFLGPAPIEDIVAHIRRSEGPSGTNREYVFRLAEALRGLGVSDPHVFDIERHLI